MSVLDPANNDARDPLDPYVESNAAQNIPYRGSVDHGRPYKTFDPVRESWADIDDGDLVEDEEELTPVPVRIVNSNNRGPEHKLFRAARTYASAGPSRIVPANKARTSLKMHNASTSATVYINSTINVSALDSYPIPPGGDLSLTSTSEVYAIAVEPDGTGGWIPASNPVGVEVLTEYTATEQ